MSISHVLQHACCCMICQCSFLSIPNGPKSADNRHTWLKCLCDPQWLHFAWTKHCHRSWILLRPVRAGQRAKQVGAVQQPGRQASELENNFIGSICSSACQLFRYDSQTAMHTASRRPSNDTRRPRAIVDVQYSGKKSFCDGFIDEILRGQM